MQYLVKLTVGTTVLCARLCQSGLRAAAVPMAGRYPVSLSSFPKTLLVGSSATIVDSSGQITGI